MKRLAHLLLLSSALFGASFHAVAQEDDGPPIPEEKLQEIKAQKVAYLTQKMDLSAEEAQKFWPVYNQYDKELEALRKERRDAMKNMKKNTDPSEAEASAAIDKEMSLQQRELDLRKKYSVEFKKSIGAVKTLKLYRGERDFNREILKRMHDRMQSGQGGPGGPGDGGRPPKP